jgi:hypothetical protein
VDRHGLGFPDAVLIDDRADNCAAFTACGSAAIRWKMGTGNIGEIIRPTVPTSTRRTQQRLTASLVRSWIFGLCELRTGPSC